MKLILTVEKTPTPRAVEINSDAITAIEQVMTLKRLAGEPARLEETTRIYLPHGVIEVFETLAEIKAKRGN